MDGLKIGKMERPYDLIVIDPPWENKSVSRAGVYECLAPHQIKTLPVAQLINQASGIVLVWVTHKQQYHNFGANNY